jgi:hypothetical protein
MTTEHDVEIAEFDWLNKRIARNNAENECGLAHEKLCAIRRQFLLEKLSAATPSKS